VATTTPRPKAATGKPSSKTPARKSGAKGSTGGRRGPTRRPSPGSVTRRPATSKGRPPSTNAGNGTRNKATAAARSSRPALGGHGPDLAGVTLVTAGLVCGLAVYGGLAGPAGRALADGAGSAFGLGRFGLPEALGVAGGLILWRRALKEYGRLAARTP
jgi:hypothetical protein